MMKPRFTLKALLCVVGILAVLYARYWQIEREVARAQENYERAWAKWEAGLGTATGICAASFGLYEAESKRWFGSGAALDRHLERLERIEALVRHVATSGLYGDEVGHARDLQKADDIRTLREGCVEWLKRP